jgi:hypothetical protein
VFIIGIIVLFFGSAAIVGIYNGATGSKASSNQVSKENKYIGINMNSIKEEKVKSGSGNEIGKRGVVMYNSDKITEESLSNFYKDKIKDSGYNYYTLINEKDKKQGIVSTGCINILSYGEIDDTGSIVKASKEVTLK